MVLATQRWGLDRADPVVCVHGVGQRGSAFAPLAERLARRGYAVVAVDLRGHGGSYGAPPWDLETHVADLLTTLDSAGIEATSWVAHSFGGRVVAELAARAPARVSRLVLVEPALAVPAEYARRAVQIERMNWSFATLDGAVNALLSAPAASGAPRDVVAAYVAEDAVRGHDGRYRFGYSPSAVIAAWNEMTRPSPPIAPVPTLLISAAASHVDAGPHETRYSEALGDLLSTATVPGGHNVLWSALSETVAAIEDFLPVAN